jgi:hypothetical protein
MGDFDASFACQLLEIPKRKVSAFQKVFIHTNELEKVHPFGQNKFGKGVSEL